MSENSQAYFYSWHCNLKAPVKAGVTTQLNRMEPDSERPALGLHPREAQCPGGSSGGPGGLAVGPDLPEPRAPLCNMAPGTHFFERTQPWHIAAANFLFLTHWFLSSVVHDFLYAEEERDFSSHSKCTRKREMRAPT